MGLWTWLTEKLIQQNAPLEASRSQVEKKNLQEADGGVATLVQAADNAPIPQDQHAPPWWKPAGVTRTEVGNPDPPEMSPEVRGLENVLVSHFDGHDLTMPPLLQAAERVLGKLRNPECDIAVLAREIAEDQVLVASVLRMVNSPLYRGNQRITALQPSITRLGLKAIRTLMIHESMRKAVFQGNDIDKELAEVLWIRSFASGYIMRALSRFTQVDKEDAFLIGLLHDIGSVIVLRIVAGYRKVCREPIDGETFDHLCFETHQEFGELVADSWNLPSELRSLIADHHSYPKPDDPLREVRLQVYLCDMISAMLGYAPPASYDLLNTHVVQELGLDKRTDFIVFLNELPDHIEEELDFS